MSFKLGDQVLVQGRHTAFIVSMGYAVVYDVKGGRGVVRYGVNRKVPNGKVEFTLDESQIQHINQEENTSIFLSNN